MQTRIRTVKPEIAQHELLFDLEKATGFPIRFAWTMLFTVCDRDGRFEWRPRILKTLCLPYDDVDFEKILELWTEQELIGRYEVRGKVYGFIPTWTKHQIINNREHASKLPPPPAQVPVPNPQLEIALVSNTSTRGARVNEIESGPFAGTGTRTGTGTGTGTPQTPAAVATDVKTTENQKIPTFTAVPVHDDAVPKGLTEVEYARHFLRDVGLPEKGNIYVAADAIRAFASFGNLSLASSFEQIKARALDDRDHGVAVDHLWILNGRYNQPKPRSKSDDYADRFNRELAILRRSNGASA
jgi:hypothetical protein